MIKVPEAFRTAPRVPPRDGRYPCTECGSRTWMAYRSGETKRGTKGVMPAPIRWCMYCKDMRHWSGRKIEEQKAWANHYSCLTCSSSTYRLRLWVSDGLTLTLPYAYCVTCDAVASRAIESRGERKADGVKKCAGCNASISDRYKWCSNCKLRQIYGHGRLGPPQRRVRAEEADVKRNCVECGEEYLPNSGTQRFCTECAAARLRTSRRKPPPKKKPANELEVEIDFSAAADDAGAAAALAAAAPPPPAGRGRGRSRAGSRAVGALSLIALDAGGPGGPASPVPPPCVRCLAARRAVPGGRVRGTVSRRGPPARRRRSGPARRRIRGARRGRILGPWAPPRPAEKGRPPRRRPLHPPRAAPAGRKRPPPRRRPLHPPRAAPAGRKRPPPRRRPLHPPRAAPAGRKRPSPPPPAAASAPRRPGRPKKAAPPPPAAASAPRRPGRPKKAAPPPAARPGAGGGSGGSAGLRAVDDAHGRGRTRGAAPGRAGAAKGRSARAASGAGRQKKAAPGKKAAKGPAGRRS